MMLNINAVPLLARGLSTKAKMAKTMERKVDATAASWGDFPNGAATKKEYEARRRPNKMWRTRMRST